MNHSAGVDYFNRGHWLSTLQARVSLGARRRMFQMWLEWCRNRGLEAASILDIGATPDTERADSNCFLEWFHAEGARVSCFSPEPIDNLTALFPFIQVIPADTLQRGIPVPEKAYDWSASSAVLEHVGSVADQVHFIAEQGRVAPALFLTTPNRFHWLEFHTKLPFLHWFPRRMHRAVLRILGLTFWAQEKNLRLLSRVELGRLAREALGDRFEIEVKTIWSLGMPSNLVLLARRVT